MRQHKSPFKSRTKEAIWRQAVDCIFGAARRLHEYRDSRDILLQYVINDQECHTRQASCDGQC